MKKRKHEMVKGKILIVEDDERITEILKRYFEKAGYHVSILNNGNSVVSHIQSDMPDLVLLDIKLPDKDGLTICREIRSFSDVPVIMVTAMVEDIDRLIGLEMGADDYICKPFFTREVVARVNAVLRRTRRNNTGDNSNMLVVGPLRMDKEKYKVTARGNEIKLTPIEFQLLKILMSSPGKVFTRNDIIQKIQGNEYNGYENTINNHIKNLRRKINKHITENEIIHTVFGVGYKIQIP